VVGGGLGPMPVEAHLLDEFLPEENLIPRIEAVIRLFNQHGNRSNKNMARLKFVVKARGWDWVKEMIEQNYAEILAGGGIPTPEFIPENFGGFQSNPQQPGAGSQLPILGATAVDPEFDRWLETNVQEQKQTGYSIVTVRVAQGNMVSAEMRGLAAIARDAGDGLVRVSIDQNLMLAYVPVHNLRRVYAALKMIGLAAAEAGMITDTLSCPGAYSCNLALTKSMNLAAVLSEEVAGFRDPQIRRMSIKISGCPNSCGQHWVADLGFYGNSRKIGGKEVPYYLMMLGGGYDREGIIRFGLAVQSIAARLAPIATRRILEHFEQNRQAGESFRDYVLRHKIAFFKEMTADLAKPIELDPEVYKDWGDDVAFSLQLGRGECAS
jgi:sulfite reductase beta subunit-like hemoprotein